MAEWQEFVIASRDFLNDCRNAERLHNVSKVGTAAELIIKIGTNILLNTQDRKYRRLNLRVLKRRFGNLHANAESGVNILLNMGFQQSQTTMKSDESRDLIYYLRLPDNHDLHVLKRQIDELSRQVNGSMAELAGRLPFEEPSPATEERKHVENEPVDEGEGERKQPEPEPAAETKDSPKSLITDEIAAAMVAAHDVNGAAGGSSPDAASDGDAAGAADERAGAANNGPTVRKSKRKQTKPPEVIRKSPQKRKRTEVKLARQPADEPFKVGDKLSVWWCGCDKGRAGCKCPDGTEYVATVTKYGRKTKKVHFTYDEGGEVGIEKANDNRIQRVEPEKPSAKVNGAKS
eukprot:72506_1